MLQIEGIKLALDQDEGLLRRKAAAELGVPEAALRDFRIFRRAVDAREGVRFVYTLRVSEIGRASCRERVCDLV